MDDEPCPYPLGHVRQPGGQRWHRVYSPYGDGRWRDYDDDGRLEAFGGPWSAVDIAAMTKPHGPRQPARFAGRHAGERSNERGIRFGGRRVAMTAASPAPEPLGVRGTWILSATGELVAAAASHELAAALVDAYNERVSA